MTAPSQSEMAQLLAFLEERPLDLRPHVRWLLLGRHMAESLHSDMVREPTLKELLQLSRWLRQEKPNLMESFMLLAGNSSHSEPLCVEVQLDALVEQDPSTWNHPVQVLARPRCPYPVLLAGCLERLEAADEAERHRLDSVASKLRSVMELEERARQRRIQRSAAPKDRITAQSWP